MHRPPTTGQPFRFGIMGTPHDARSWRQLATRVEDLGFSTLVVPDGMQLLSPLPALALAAGATSRLHVGTFVLAAPLRPAAAAAWDAHTLSVLSGGRFELGLGTGRPEVVRQAVDRLGAAETSIGQRLARVAATVDELRALDGGDRIRVLMAAGGPRSLRIAATRADTVTFAAGALTGRETLAGMAVELRELAAGRDVEVAVNIFVIGDQMSPWVRGFLGTDVATLREHDSQAILPGDPDEMADELRRRRDLYGLSYVITSAANLEQMAPVAAKLTGT